MERHDILEAMSELKLYGMRASFDEIAGKGLSRRDEFYPFLASLIRAERTHRQARSISYRIGGAKFPVLKDLDSFVFADTPVDEGEVRELATGTFLDARRNAIFIGGTDMAAGERLLAAVRKAFFGPMLELLQGNRAVELAGEEMLDLAQTKEAARSGIFDDKGFLLCRLMLADQQIISPHQLGS